MISELQSALSGGPWAYSGLLYGLDTSLDEEGRPLAERRAPSAVKKSVEIELRPCPYPDERRGSPMNVSALAQITRHLDAVLADVAAFRRLTGQQRPSWLDALTTVLDQLAGPATFALRSRDAERPIPAGRAVGHKLAAGYFGVVRGIHRSLALGEVVDTSVEALLSVVHRTDALLGASEACAGPPRLIRRVSEMLLDPVPEGAPLDDAARPAIARNLAAQVSLGIVWELFDAALERELLTNEAPLARLAPRNTFMQRRVEQRLLQLESLEETVTPAAAARALSSTVEGSELDALAAAMRRAVEVRQSVDDEASRKLAALIARGEGAFRCDLTADRLDLARRIRAFLPVYTAFLARLWRLEAELRRCVDLPVSAPMKLNKLVLPSSRSLGWFEAVLGHRVASEPAEAPRIVIRNARRRADLTALLRPAPDELVAP